jgi:hypothetical protein
MTVKPTLTAAAALAALLTFAGPCQALWLIMEVTKKDAPGLGIEVRSSAAGPDAVRVEMEFKLDGDLKRFSQVDLRVGEGDKVVTAALKEDRSKPGRVVVSFSTPRERLDQTRLWVFVPGTLGGTIYEVKAKDFVEQEKPTGR